MNDLEGERDKIASHTMCRCALYMSMHEHDLNKLHTNLSFTVQKFITNNNGFSKANYCN